MSPVERLVTDTPLTSVALSGSPLPMAKPLLSALSSVLHRSSLRELADRAVVCVVAAAIIGSAADTSAAGPQSSRTTPRVVSRFAAPAEPPSPDARPPVDRLKPIGEIALPASPGKSPEPDFATERFSLEQTEVQGPGASRAWPTSVYAWEAPSLCHRPLYFEDENLERYGQSFGMVQPAVSAAHFFGRAVALPYQMGAFPPHECVYTLGKGRPGSYTPYYVYRPPVSARGALYQAGAVTGLSFFVP